MLEGTERLPHSRARLAGLVYALVFVTGIYAVMRLPGAAVANLIATVCYVAVTVLFYFIFRPAGRSVSLLAAAVSLAGCAMGALLTFQVAPFRVHPLVFFGFYCLLIGYLIFQSTFLPRILGIGMVIGGLGWLTFVSPALSQQLFPWNLAPGIIGEGALTLWLLIKGVDEERWRAQGRA